MVDSVGELLVKTRTGEHMNLVLRSVRFRGAHVHIPRHDELADEIAAMANTHDGIIILGVDDRTRDIEGIPLDKMEAVERYLFEISTDSITPPVIFRAFRMEVPDMLGNLKPILKVEVPRSLFVHKSPGGYFHRQGSSKREMSPEYLARLFQQRSQARLIRFEEQAVPGTTIGDLDEKLWPRYVGKSYEPDEAVLVKRGLLTREEAGALRCSVAGVLLCCERPECFLKNAYIEAVRYRGIRQDTNYQMDAQRIYGPLERQINQAMAFLKRDQAVMAVKMPHRVERPQFSERAVFEAVVNAVAHRDYSIAGSKIRYFIFDDRLELYSPGALPNTVTVESIHLRQATRNELITSLLAETPVAGESYQVGRGYFMEKRGDGVPIILYESEKLSGRKPVYRLIDDAELLLTIYASPVDESADG